QMNSSKEDCTKSNLRGAKPRLGFYSVESRIFQVLRPIILTILTLVMPFNFLRGSQEYSLYNPSDDHPPQSGETITDFRSYRACSTLVVDCLMLVLRRISAPR